jgi:deoxycytidine triphosphate deaminase
VKILSDIEIKKLIGKVIIGGDESCVRFNAYIMRLGSEGVIHNTGEEFELSNKKKKEIVIPQGHSVGVVALETIDFKRDAVRELYPENDLCGSLWPTRELLREGIVVPATHVDAGYAGTLKWTLTNTASVDRRYLCGERICRLTIYRLEVDEIPEFPYEGDYQGTTGYVRSRSQEKF